MMHSKQKIDDILHSFVLKLKRYILFRAPSEQWPGSSISDKHEHFVKKKEDEELEAKGSYTFHEASGGKISETEDDMPTIDLKRLVILRFVAHVGDFVTPKHTPPSDSSDVRVKQYIATRECFTKKNKTATSASYKEKQKNSRKSMLDDYWGRIEESDRRLPVPFWDFIDKFNVSY